VEEGETLEETALREVREETGIYGRLLEKLGEIRYDFYSKQDREKILKTVHFYLLVYLSGSEADHDEEADEARWFPIAEAQKRLSHPNEAAMLRKASLILMPVQ
jgi:8-oxo-dGTP pyrophosphatase MutT (NUDIX family)